MPTACSPERKISDGDGVPCRHCLRNVAAGDAYLVLAYRPFPALQPYAETGPIFLHARECDRRREIRRRCQPCLQRPATTSCAGYGADDRIIYGTGAVVPTPAIVARAAELLASPDTAYLHMRSARNNCYQCRIERG